MKKSRICDKCKTVVTEDTDQCPNCGNLLLEDSKQYDIIRKDGENEMKKIKLTQGKYALVDDEDYIILSQIKWCAVKTRYGCFYAIGKVERKQIFMHRFILGNPKGYIIDHKNNNGLDNRKINLRACTIGQNTKSKKLGVRNTSGYKGVTYLKESKYKKKPWQARIKCEGKSHFLGNHGCPKKAASMYDREAKKRFGQFAMTNKMLGLLN